MHIKELSKKLGLKPEQIAELCRVCAENPKTVYAALQQRINLRHSTGRDATEAGDDVVDPPPVKVNVLREFGDYKAGICEMSYRQAVAMCETGHAEMVKA